MIIASVKEDNTSLLLGDAKASLKSSPMGSSPNSLNGQPPDSPSVPAIFTDVNVVPEQDKNQLEQLIANLEGEILQLRQKQNLFDKKRREALNKLLDMKGSIRVFCRVRPYLMTSRRKIREPISTGSEMIVVRSSGIRKEFNFDKVFPQEASQEEIFVEIAPLLRSALDGHHVSILAFGQTGTGKTFTMDGTNDQIGIIPRALEELFSQASLDKSSSLNFSMSMLEVYMGNLRDLLSPKPPYRAYEAATRYNLNIQTDPKGLVEIEGLTEVQIPDFGKARWWYNKGKRVRSTSWTNVNEASSRSHCLTRITVFRRGDALEANTEVSKLWMVDLGGSERLLKTGATGQTLDEGRAINLSISALGDVIAALKRKRGHVPYRNSKLTQILKDSLGDGSKVLMLVHVSPCEEDVGETICSLNFAKRARAVESVKELPEELKKHRERRIVELEKDMREAEEEIQKITKQIQMAEFLLSENKKLFSTPNKSFEAAEKNLQGPNEDLKEVIRTTQKSEKAGRRSVGSSLPRFMTSTVASRQRQSIAEREIVGKVSSLQSGTRNSVQLSGSQSLSFSDFRFKSIVRSSNKKTRHGEMNAPLTVSPKCKDLDLKVPSLPRSKMVTSSDPNLRVTLCRHKRRMSDFI